MGTFSPNRFFRPRERGTAQGAPALALHSSSAGKIASHGTRWTALLLALWIVAGLTGHDPWKPDEAYSFGLVHSYTLDHDWVVPMLAGEPFMEKPPLFYLTAAVLVKALSPWLPAHDVARLASGLFVAFSFLLIALSAREMWGREGAWVAPLCLAGSVEMLINAHFLITDLAQFAGFALAFHGLIIGRRQAIWGGVCLGTGAGVGLMSKGLFAPGCLYVLVALLPLVSVQWRSRAYRTSVCISVLTLLPWVLIWPGLLYMRDPQLFHEWFWDNNVGRFLGLNDLGPPGGVSFVVQALIWTTFPAGIAAVRASWRAHLQPGRRPFYVLLWCGTGVIFGVLCASRQARGLYLLPILIPVCLLAVPGLLDLGQRAQRRLAIGGAVFWSSVVALLWTGALALYQGAPAAVHMALVRYQPEYSGHLGVTGWSLAAALFAGWVWVSLRLLADTLRPMLVWVAGLTIAWGTFTLFFVSYLDTGKSYRSVATSLASVPGIHRDCIASVGLGEPQRAMLQYFAGIQTMRWERDSVSLYVCNWLLYQAPLRTGPFPGPLWNPAWEGARPGDEREHFRLYRRVIR